MKPKRINKELTMKRRILIISGRYLPGFKDGGPVRSILNLTKWFGEDYDIRIMCLDRDHGDDKAYEGIKVNDWNEVGKARVWYTPSFNATDIAKLTDAVDVVYCCGPYNDYAIAAMRLKKNGRMKAPLYVASMGSFSPEAFNIKGWKKKLYVKAMRSFGLFKNITWSVTSAREEDELKSIIGSDAECVIASDLARGELTKHTAVKEKGKINLIFLSRISRKKNLSAVAGILQLLGSDINVNLDIYGVLEDEAYLKECTEEFKKLPANIVWEYKGEIDSGRVPEVFAEYDAFIFPTLGENYGHVIAESLSAGCIPIISDTTPWLDLDENGAGYVCKLNDNEAFRAAIMEIADMDRSEFEAKCNKCHDYIDRKNKNEIANSGYKKIFG